MSKILNAQIKFYASEMGFQSAQNVIFQKIRNSYYLLQQYEASARKNESDAEKIIKDCRIYIYRKQERVLYSETRQQIMLCEARASRRYWYAIGLICKQDKNWNRTQKHPNDILNKALNIGYHWLCNECKKALKEVELFLDIGFLHSNNLKSPLAYDFMEPFRQPFIDKIIIPIFLRKRKIDEENVAKIVVAKCNQNFSKNILIRETKNLKYSILHKVEYIGYKYKWGHTKRKTTGAKHGGLKLRFKVLK